MLLQMDGPISRVAVIGGGRWARVIAGTLHHMLPTHVSLSIHSERNSTELKSWSRSFEGGGEILISEKWPQLRKSRDCAVIVVNAARDHGSAVRRAIDACAPVLVEKPVALTALEVEALIAMSNASNTQFAAAHVLFFARYIEQFANQVTSIAAIRLRWTDPCTELRYGENKQYDPGLPVYADWLPHIFSILYQLVPEEMSLLGDIAFLRGGAHLIFILGNDTIQCRVELERNAISRERLVEVELQNGQIYQLDFSSEPGRIHDGDNWSNGDPQWNCAPRPVASMLYSFLTWVSGGRFDKRLDCVNGLLASRLIDQVKIVYEGARNKWLNEQSPNLEVARPLEVEYALSELVQASGRLSEAERLRRISDWRIYD